LMMGPAELRAYVDANGSVPLNTDDFPYLEYFVPRDLFYQVLDNSSEFARNLTNPGDLVSGLPPSSRAALEPLLADRVRLLTESSE
jgi:hypothetical protein